MVKELEGTKYIARSGSDYKQYGEGGMHNRLSYSYAQSQLE